MATTPEQGDVAGPSQGYDASDFTSLTLTGLSAVVRFQTGGRTRTKIPPAGAQAGIEPLTLQHW